jgi:Flp pilus assembly pilin Flp
MQHIDDLTIRAYVAMQSLKQRLVEEQEGQTAVEYAGILALLATIFVALFGMGLAGDIKGVVEDAIREITTGKGE